MQKPDVIERCITFHDRAYSRTIFKKGEYVHKLRKKLQQDPEDHDGEKFITKLMGLKSKLFGCDIHMGEFDTDMMVMSRTHLTSSDRNSIIAVVDFEESKGLNNSTNILRVSINNNTTRETGPFLKTKNKTAREQQQPMTQQQQQQQTYQRHRSLSLAAHQQQQQQHNTSRYNSILSNIFATNSEKNS